MIVNADEDGADDDNMTMIKRTARSEGGSWQTIIFGEWWKKDGGEAGVIFCVWGVGADLSRRTTLFPRLYHLERRDRRRHQHRPTYFDNNATNNDTR